MAQKDIKGPIDDNALNSVNHNFTELYSDVRDTSGKINKVEQNINKRMDNFIDETSDVAFDKVVDSARIDWSQMVDNKSDLPSNARKGATIGVKEDGLVYRYDGSKWVDIYEINLNPISEVDERLSSQLMKTDEFLSKNGLLNRRTPHPMITWVDDDGKKGLFTKLYHIFKSRGIPLTAAIIPDRVGTNGYVSKLEMKEMMENGLEIVSHTNEHNPNDRPINLPKDRLREGYRSAKEKIIEWGGNPHCVVYPFGNYNEAIDEVAREYHNYAFDIGTLDGIVEPPINSYKITRYNPMNKPIEDVKAKLDEAYDKNGWIIIISHVDESSYDEDKSIELIDYAISKGFEFVTTEKGIGYHGNLLELDAENTIDKNGNIHSNKIGKTRVTKDNEKLAEALPNEFDTGITMTKIDLSSSNNTNGLPLELYGTLVTHKSSDLTNWTHQTFYAGFRQLVARRHSVSGNKWSDWNVDYMPDGHGELADNSKPRDYPLGTITTTIEGPNATDTPGNKGGIIVTTKTKDSYLWMYQEFFDVTNNETYTRRADSLDQWRSWRRVKNFYHYDINELDGTLPAGAYANGMTHVYVRNNADGLPSASGNLLTLNQFGKGRGYQFFRTSDSSTELFFRGENSDGDWHAWKRVVLEDI